MQVAKCLIAHALSSGYIVSSLQLRIGRKTTQQWSIRLANDIVLNRVRVYHERMYADNVVRKLWFVMSFFSQRYPKFITNITFGNVSQIRTEECKTRFFICKLNLNFLRSSRRFNCDTAFTVFVPVLNESVHGLNNIRSATVQTSLQIAELRRL